jgi:hypothetical protein
MTELANAGDCGVNPTVSLGERGTETVAATGLFAGATPLAGTVPGTEMVLLILLVFTDRICAPEIML